MQLQRFFSIVIPAHNEERYIISTLECIRALDYPHDRFEAIVIENGSSDRTYEEAKRFENDVIKVYTLPVRGVSPARNAGIDRLNPQSDWTVFLDADTLLAPSFLSDLDAYLARPRASSYTVGTTVVRPTSEKLGPKLWFAWYDLGHMITKTSYSIFIVRADLLKTIRFDETLSMGEDLKVIRDARHYGSFFFFRTGTVSTSTRRFDQEGYGKVFFSWIFVAMLPPSLQRRFSYKVIR